MARSIVERQDVAPRSPRASVVTTAVSAAICLLVFFQCGLNGEVRADALSKLKPAKLAAIQESLQALRAARRELPLRGPGGEYCANLHVHSAWSHDSRGTIDEIVAAARRAGTQVLMFNEHPADHYDYLQQGHRGIRDGVLLIPGAETQGFLLFPTLSTARMTFAAPQDLADFVRSRGGQAFVSHLEERMDWKVRGVTGVEIYNTHADFKDEQGLVAALKNPFKIFQLSEAFRAFPQEAYSALLDYPRDYLRKWDALCQQAPHTGVSANDAHQNIGLIVRWTGPDRARLEDALGQPLLELDLANLPGAEKLLEGRKVGDTLFELILDRYEFALRHVATHLRMSELTEAAVREALDQGRAFVAFDWMVDARGFDFAAEADGRRWEMGSQPRLPTASDPPANRHAGLSLSAVAPLSTHWKLFRDGQIEEESDGDTLRYRVTQPGVYRCEAWLDVAGQPTIWILSNPIYVRAADP
ncbi:MAG: hypothetical protein FJ295_12835 [Planctomycetes bacterium]|nr:hypothetical protein [Planctomycetota bacterium]